MGYASPMLCLNYNYLEKKMNDAQKMAAPKVLVNYISEMGSPSQ